MPSKKAKKPTKKLYDVDLHDLSPVGARLDGDAGRSYAAQASVCLRNGRPKGDITLSLRADDQVRTLSVRARPITAAMRATYADLGDATEHGAYGFALLLSATQLGYRLAQRSYKGTGFDFFLVPAGQEPSDPDDLYADTFALEVSGILQGDDAEMRRRRKEKADRVKDRGYASTLIAIIEFSRPAALLEHV